MAGLAASRARGRVRVGAGPRSTPPNSRTPRRWRPQERQCREMAELLRVGPLALYRALRDRERGTANQR